MLKKYKIATTISLKECDTIEKYKKYLKEITDIILDNDLYSKIKCHKDSDFDMIQYEDGKYGLLIYQHSYYCILRLDEEL